MTSDMTENGDALSSPEIWSLFSGSKGNSTYVKYKNTEILIDAGKSYRAVCDALKSVGGSVDRLDAVFITHEHSDHVRGIPMLLKRSSACIHVTNESSGKLGFPEKVYVELGRMVCHEPEFTCTVKDIEVRSFRLPHDSAMCVGYRIDCGDTSVGLMTDCGYPPPEALECLHGCDAVMLEANHDRDMLLHGSYPEHLKHRILSDGGHLSNEVCGEAAAELCRFGTSIFALSHLSEENNTPELALRSVGAALARHEISGRMLYVMSQDEPTRLI